MRNLSDGLSYSKCCSMKCCSKKSCRPKATPYVCRTNTPFVCRRNTPFVSRTNQSDTFYKDQSFQRNPVLNLKDSKLKHPSVDLSYSKCYSEECNSKKSCKDTLLVFKTSQSDMCYKDQSFESNSVLNLRDLKLKQLAVDLSYSKCYSNEFYSEESYKTPPLVCKTNQSDVFYKDQSFESNTFLYLKDLKLKQLTVDLIYSKYCSNKCYSKESYKTPPLVCKTSQSDMCYKDPSFESNPDFNFKDLKLKPLSVDLSYSKCCSKVCEGDNSIKNVRCMCKNCRSVIYNKTLVEKFKLKPLSIILTDFKTNKSEFVRKNSYNHLVCPLEIKSKPDKTKLEKHKLSADLEGKGHVFCKSSVKEDLLSSSEQKISLAGLELFKNKINLTKASIKLHQIEKTVAFCRNLNLQPVWKGALSKSPVKFKKSFPAKNINRKSFVKKTKSVKSFNLL